MAVLRPGAYGISEPPDNAPAVPPECVDLAIIPCAGAAADGRRLGRGGGYYDRFLAQYKGARLLLCPTATVLNGLPCDAWDARFAPEEILTEKGIQL